MSRLTCTDCIHDYVCHNLNNLNYWNKDDPNGDPMDKFCLCFKNKELFIELPCKVGDAVWIVVKTDDGYEIQKDFVSSICVQRHGDFGIEMRFADTISTIMLSYIPMKAFGEVVFLTKAEAEAKLEELKEGDCDEIM